MWTVPLTGTGGWENNEMTRSNQTYEIEVNRCGGPCNMLASKEGLGVSKRKFNESKLLEDCLKKAQ